MIEQIPLEQIQPNPFQTRQSEDAEHIQNLAFSIAERGLLQVPTGRRVGDRVQLTFGHSRKAAYQLMANIEQAAEGETGFDTTPFPKSLIEAVLASLENGNSYQEMPVNIQELTDEEMFELAVTENHERKDLNPLEEAQAMATYRDQFGKTSEEIGQLFHLSDSAVRNKIRLLNLPADVKESLGKGQMTEGAARALLPFYALPEEIRTTWEKWDKNTAPFNVPNREKSLTDQALAGDVGSEEIGARLARMQERHSHNLASAWWKFDDKLNSNDVRSLTCRDCPLRKDQICIDEACYSEKKKIYQRNYLYLASRTSGIKEIEEDREHDHTDLGVSRYWEGNKADNEKAAAVIGGGCENLRLAFDDGDQPVKNAVHCVKGFPRAMVVCRNHNGQCRCQTGYQAAIQAQQRPDEMDADELRQAAADQYKTKRTETEMIGKLQELAADLLGRAAANYDNQALIQLVIRSGLYSGGVTDQQSWPVVAREKARRIFSANLEYLSLQGWLLATNQILADCNLPQLTAENVGSTADELLAREPAEMVWKL